MTGNRRQILEDGRQKLKHSRPPFSVLCHLIQSLDMGAFLGQLEQLE